MLFLVFPLLGLLLHIFKSSMKIWPFSKSSQEVKFYHLKQNKNPWPFSYQHFTFMTLPLLYFLVCLFQKLKSKLSDDWQALHMAHWLLCTEWPQFSMYSSFLVPLTKVYWVHVKLKVEPELGKNYCRWPNLLLKQDSVILNQVVFSIC